MRTPEIGTTNRKSSSHCDVSIADRLASGGFLTVDEFAGWLGISRGLVYKEKKAGRIKLTRIGKRSLVAAAAATAYRDSLEAA